MDKKTLNPNDDSTVIKPSSISATPQKPEEALTRIRESFQSIDTSQGFKKAEKDVNSALEENKIVLNNRFILETILGVGGMGTVYKAQDLRKVEARDISPYVAVKVLNNEFKDHPDAFITLQRETSRSHILSHPNIVTVHDFDRDGDVIYMTMELLEGEGLDSLLNANKNIGLPIHQALKIISDYSKALEYAHKNNIIHSDLKPGNIFITESAAKVVDFGIARVTANAQYADDFDAGTLGAITPAYASLEMIQNKEPDQSDDVYAAAIIAYELFTGTHPYNREPADKALAKGLIPKRIKQLSSRQWNALNSALKLTRNQRTTTIVEFVDELTLKKKRPYFKWASVILIVAIGWFAYDKFYAPNELTSVIEDTLVKGKDCYAKQNYTCAIESTNVVLEISPSHKEALSLKATSTKKHLELQVTALVSKVNDCVSNNDVLCAENNLNSLISLQPNSNHISNLQHKISSRQQSIKLNEILDAAQLCFDEKDYHCVLSKTELIMQDITVSNETVEYFKINALVDKSNIKIANINDAFNSHIAKGKRCFKQNKFSCADKQAKLALQYKNNDAVAKALEQKAQFSQSERNRSIKKVKKILSKAKKCLQIKNYSCAIAKSESALELIPNYSAAVKLRKKATNAVNKLKSSIIIE